MAARERTRLKGVPALAGGSPHAVRHLQEAHRHRGVGRLPSRSPNPQYLGPNGYWRRNEMPTGPQRPCLDISSTSEPIRASTDDLSIIVIEFDEKLMMKHSLRAVTLLA